MTPTKKLSKYFHEVPNKYLTQFIINSKEMIKYIELRTPEDVDKKLNQFKENGWDLGHNFVQITYVPEIGFYMWYDEKLELN